MVQGEITYVCSIKICKEHENGHLRHDELVEFGKVFAFCIGAGYACFAGLFEG